MKQIREYIEEHGKDHIQKLKAENQQKLKEIAERNTIRNEDGLTVIEKDDIWREED